MNIKLTVFGIALLFTGNLVAGESLFGSGDNSIGFLHLPYSAAGAARSYEIANYDSLHMNFQNYSLWSQISNTTYTIMGGYAGAYGDDGVKSNYYSDLANFQGGFLGIPILRKKLAIGLGIQPVSNIDRSYTDTFNEDLNETLYIRGGISKALINVSYNYKNRYGIGLGYEYVFGKIADNYILEDPDVSVTRLSIDYEYRFYGHGMVISAFARPVQNLTLGLTVRPPLNTKLRIQAFTTSDNVNQSKIRDITFPGQYNLGLEYRLNHRNHIGLDLLYQDWTNGYKINNKNYSKDQDKFYRFGIGYERTQSEKRFTKLREEIDYRAGLFYGNLNQLSNGSSVREYGVSFGFSLPIQRFVSEIDLSCLIGKRGNLDKNSYEETFFSLGFTISASEIWFINIDD